MKRNQAVIYRANFPSKTLNVSNPALCYRKIPALIIHPSFQTYSPSCGLEEGLRVNEGEAEELGVLVRVIR